jgi:hypothetical protein
MDEIIPGVIHWSAIHPNTGVPAHSAFLLETGTLIDPIAPEEGLAWFDERTPQRALLTNRHHLRSAEEFGCPLFCHPAGMHEFADGLDVQSMLPGDTPAPGVTVLEVGAITPEEVALHVEVGPGAVALGDCVLRGGRDGTLRFMPDWLLGDDAEGVKRGLRAALGRIVAEQEFDALLLAHGAPRASGGHAELEGFVKGA